VTSYEQYEPGTRPRAIPGVSVTMPTPVIVDGRPTLPRYKGSSDSHCTVLQGPKHLHAIPDPDPYHAPDLPQPPKPKPSTPAGIWRVHDLPDPSRFNNGWYWLGSRTSRDGTAGLPDACSHWPASAGSFAGAPSWHSRYPFKPSVVSAQHWLYGGGTADHPKAVNFNSQFIEHMWLDWGRSRPQPFTWAVAAMLPTYPEWNYMHYLLDAGRNPFDVGLPGWYGAGNCYTARNLHEPLGYRTLLTATKTKVRAATTGTRGVESNHHANVVPRMYFGVYNGAHSMAGNFTPKATFVRRGALHSAGESHRYTVLGRKQGRLSQGSASHLLVFEIRFYHDALNLDQLGQLFHYLSSKYRFGRY